MRGNKLEIIKELSNTLSMHREPHKVYIHIYIYIYDLTFLINYNSI